MNSCCPSRATIVGRAGTGRNEDNAANNILTRSLMKRLLSIALIFLVTSNGASLNERAGVVATEAKEGGNASKESRSGRYHHQPHHTTGFAGAESMLSSTPSLIRHGDRIDAKHRKPMGSTISESPSPTDDSALTVNFSRSEWQKPQRPIGRRRTGKKHGILHVKKQRRGQQVNNPSPFQSPDEQHEIYLAGRTMEHNIGVRTVKDNFHEDDDNKKAASPPLVATEENDAGIYAASTHSPTIEEQLPPYKLTTSFDGTKMGYGIMFDITASASPSPTSSCSSFTSITIESIDVHLSLNNNNIPIRVYVTPDTYSGKEHSPSEWESVADHVVQGQGRGNPTPVPGEAFQSGRRIELSPGETIGMYVTLVDSTHIVYSESPSTMTNGGHETTTSGAFGDDAEDIDREDGFATATSNCHLGVSSGAGIKFLFGEAYQDRDFNGVLRYRVHHNDDQQLLPAPGEGMGGRGNASLQHQQQQPPLALHSLDVAEERSRRRGKNQREGDSSAVENDYERRVTSHGIVFEVSSAFSPSGIEAGDTAEEAGVTMIRGMALRTLLQEGEWARVEVYTKSGSYEQRRRSLGGGYDGNDEDSAHRGGIGREWILILDEFVHGIGNGGDYVGTDGLLSEGDNNPMGHAGQLSHFVEPVRILDGGDGVQSFFVVISCPVLLSTVTDDAMGEDQATPSSSTSSALNVLSGRSVDSYPADPSSTKYSSVTTPLGGEEVSNEGGRTMLFDGILLYSTTRQEGNPSSIPSTASPTPSPTATQTFTPYPTASSLLSTYTDIRTLTTGYDFADERLSHGNIFDLVVAEDRGGPIVITTLSFHVNLGRVVGDDVDDTTASGEDVRSPTNDVTNVATTLYGVRVYSKPGTYRNGVDDAALWEKVADVTLPPGDINDEGMGATIPLEHFRNVMMEPGSTRAFLLVFSTPNVVTSPYVGRDDRGTNSSSSSMGGTFSVVVNSSDRGASGNNVEDSTVYAGNSDLSLLVGSGVGRYGFDFDEERHFDDLFDDRVWHGTIHYRTTEETDNPTPTPTISPTPMPTNQRTPTPTRLEALTHNTDRELLTTWVGGAVGRRCEFDLRVADSDERNTRQHGRGGGGAIVVRSLDVAVVTNYSSDGRNDEEHVERILRGISLHLKNPLGDDDGVTSSAMHWTERSSTASVLRSDDEAREGGGHRDYLVVHLELDAPLVLPDGAAARFSVVLPTSDLVYTEVEQDSERDGEGDVYASNIDVGLLAGVCSATDGGIGDEYNDDESGQSITLHNDGDEIHNPAGISIPGVFNGIVHYSVRTASPTSAPTLVPTTGTTGGGTTKAVVAQQMITLKGISRRRWLQRRPHNRQPREGGDGCSRTRMLMRRLTSSVDLSPVLEDERAVEFFEDTVLSFVRQWIRRTNPTLAVRQVMVSSDITDDEVTFIDGDGQDDGDEGNDRDRRLRQSRTSVTDDETSTEVPYLRGSKDHSRQSSPLWPPNKLQRELREGDGEDDSIDDPPSLNVYTTITGDYTPPPDVVFDALVEDTFVDNGEVFVRELNEDPAFEEVTGVETRTVRFPLPSLPTTSSDGKLNQFASWLSPGTTMGLVLIIVFAIGGLAVVLLVCGCAFFAVRRRRKKEEHKRREIVRESERLRSATVELCEDDGYHRVGGIADAPASEEEDTTDDDSDYAAGRRRPIIVSRSAVGAAAVAIGSNMNSEGVDRSDDATSDEDDTRRRREGGAEDSDKDSNSEEQERKKKGPVLAPRTRASVSRRRRRKKRTNVPRVTPRRKKVKASAA